MLRALRTVRRRPSTGAAVMENHNHGGFVQTATTRSSAVSSPRSPFSSTGTTSTASPRSADGAARHVHAKFRQVVPTVGPAGRPGRGRRAAPGRLPGLPSSTRATSRRARGPRAVATCAMLDEAPGSTRARGCAGRDAHAARLDDPGRGYRQGAPRAHGAARAGSLRTCRSRRTATGAGRRTILDPARGLGYIAMLVQIRGGPRTPDVTTADGTSQGCSSRAGDDSVLFKAWATITRQRGVRELSRRRSDGETRRPGAGRAASSYGDSPDYYDPTSAARLRTGKRRSSWLEANGYRVDYATDWDLQVDPEP